MWTAANVQKAPDALAKALSESRQFQKESLKSLEKKNQEKIEKREVVASLEDITGSEVKIGKGIGILPYPVEIIYQVISDYNNYKDFMPFTKESKIDLSRSNKKVIYFYSKLSFPLFGERYYSLKITGEENVGGKTRTFFIAWSLDPERKSNLHLNSGSWKLLPYGARGEETLALYTVITDTGGNIPNYLKNKSTALAIPSVFKAVSNRAREGLSAGIYKKWAVRLEKSGLSNFHQVTKDLYREAQPTMEGIVQLVTI